jgi:hypothetical protein
MDISTSCFLVLSPDLNLNSQNDISQPKFDALSTGKLVLSQIAVAYTNILIFDWKFQLSGLEVKKCCISCNNLKDIYVTSVTDAFLEQMYLFV